MSPQESDATTEKHEPSAQPSSLVNEDGSNVKKKKKTDNGEESRYSNVAAIRKFFQRNPPTPQGIFNLIVAIATVLLTVIACLQYGVQKMERRAAVYLGRQDGEIGALLPGEDVLRIVLYFRNAGATAAQRTVIETWPITLAIGGPKVELNFPAPDRRYIGPSIPPGSPLKKYIPYPDATREELESGAKSLTIYGRITYSDIFGQYCETFVVAYGGPPLHQFVLAPDTAPLLFPDICESKQQENKK